MDNKRKKGNIIESGDILIDNLRVNCINKILCFDHTINFDSFDFIFGGLKSRPKRLINFLISLECIPHLERIALIIFPAHNNNI